VGIWVEKKHGLAGPCKTRGREIFGGQPKKGHFQKIEGGGGPAGRKGDPVARLAAQPKKQKTHSRGGAVPLEGF